MEIKFDKEPLAVDQNNHTNKILNVFIVYDLDGWPKNPNSRLNLKKSLFGITSLAKIVIKKYVYSGYETTFDSAGSRSFDNYIARNVILLIIVHHLMPTIATITF